MEQATVSSGPNVATAQARTSGAAAWARRAAAAGSQAGRRAVRWNTAAVLGEANIVALRGWELSCVAMWAVGLWLVFRLGGSRPWFVGRRPTELGVAWAGRAKPARTKIYLGLYTGASALAFW